MSHLNKLTENTVLDARHEGEDMHNVIIEDISLTLSKDNFIAGDIIKLFNDSGSVITISMQTGVTVSSVGLNIPLCGMIELIMIEDNKWIAGGDLQ